MQFKNMFFQTSFLICCIWTVLANKGFFASMDSDMSDNISITWKWFVANRTSKSFWAKFVTLQNKNLLNFVRDLKIAIMIFFNMCFQISFLSCSIIAKHAMIWFFACMDSDVSDKVSIHLKCFFATNRTSTRF